MMSSFEENQRKLLVLDVDFNRISLEKIQNYFLQFGSIESIENFENFSSISIRFSTVNVVDRLVQLSFCLIENFAVRLRRFRSDLLSAHLDCFTLRMKFEAKKSKIQWLNEISLRQCFSSYQSSICSIDLIDENQALINFRHYDSVDQILLQPVEHFRINNCSLQLERIMTKSHRKTRWDDPSQPLTNQPTLAQRNPLVYRLLSHIEYLTKKLRGKKNRFVFFSMD